MAINEIQFQKGLSLMQFMNEYGTETQCEAVLAKARWQHGFECPRCAHALAYEFRRGGIATGNAKPAIIKRVCARGPSWNMDVCH